MSYKQRVSHAQSPRHLIHDKRATSLHDKLLSDCTVTNSRDEILCRLHRKSNR